MIEGEREREKMSPTWNYCKMQNGIKHSTCWKNKIHRE